MRVHPMTDHDPSERAVNVALFLALTLVWPGLIISSFWRVPWQYATASAIFYVGVIAGLAVVGTRKDSD